RCRGDCPFLGGCRLLPVRIAEFLKAPRGFRHLALELGSERSSLGSQGVLLDVSSPYKTSDTPRDRHTRRDACLTMPANDRLTRPSYSVGTGCGVTGSS